MGVLEELLRQLAEAAEQQKRTTLPGTPPAAKPSTPVKPSAGSRPPTSKQQPAKSSRVADATDSGESRTVRQLASTAPALVIHRGEQHPILSRFRQPGGAQDAVVLAEIMAPRGRWRRR